jgi:hypothetical protein
VEPGGSIVVAGMAGIGAIETSSSSGAMAQFAPKPTSTPTSRMVLSVDEKSQIQALDRKQPSCR